MSRSLINHIRMKLAYIDARIDPVYAEAKALVLRTNNFSISHLQRHLLLGYRRACRIMDRIKREVVAQEVKG